jgi:16S rRNA (uracil1498-N3)-methyltransferase
VEKCTELGVSALFPLITDLSVRKSSANTLSRFQKIAIAAIKQCDNPWIPEIFPPQDLNRALENIKTQGYNPILCSERNQSNGCLICQLKKQENLFFDWSRGWLEHRRI